MRTSRDIVLRLVLGAACSTFTILGAGHLFGGGGGYGAEMGLTMFVFPAGSVVSGLLCGAVSVSLPRETPEKRERSWPVLVGAVLGLVGGIQAVEARCLAPSAWDLDFRWLFPVLLLYALPMALTFVFVHVLFDFLAKPRG